VSFNCLENEVSEMVAVPCQVPARLVPPPLPPPGMPVPGFVFVGHAVNIKPNAAARINLIAQTSCFNHCGVGSSRLPE
jgi:hypothetical protein